MNLGIGNKFNLIILGLSGGGKGEQSKLLAARFDLKNISVGELLRRQIADKTKIGKEVASFVDSGRLVPDKLVIKLIASSLKELSGKGFVLDGAPRTINQAKALDKLFFKQKIHINAIFLIKIRDKVVLERRAKSIRVGKSFQDGRKDNSLADFKRRFSFYKKNIGDLIDFYRSKGILIEINGERSIREIHRDIVSRLKEI